MGERKPGGTEWGQGAQREKYQAGERTEEEEEDSRKVAGSAERSCHDGDQSSGQRCSSY